MAHLELITESGEYLTTESGSHITSEDAILPPPKLTGKKLLAFPEINHVQGKIRVRGNTRLPQGNQVITIRASLAQLVAEGMSYSGIISTVHDGILIGTFTVPIQNKSSLIGSMSKNTTTESIIEGKKDYDKVVKLLEEVFLEL